MIQTTRATLLTEMACEIFELPFFFEKNLIFIDAKGFFELFFEERISIRISQNSPHFPTIVILPFLADGSHCII